MGTHLHQLLQNVCWNTEWNYAVFWKLKHRARMILTWEDGYYDNQYKLDPSENKRFSESLNEDAHFAKDSLGLAVAKMSYHVYSLGEGVVGQVAVSGNHQWIFSGEHAMNSYSPSLELCDGWQAQFAAGIKTIVVAAVVPHGVVQFGSLNKVNENLQYLAHIRDAFSSLQESAFHMRTPMQCNLQHMLQSDIYLRNLSPNVLQDYALEKAANMDNTCSNSADILSLPKHPNDFNRASVPGVHLKKPVGLISTNGLSQAIGNSKVVQAVPSEIKHSTNLLSSDYTMNSSTIQTTGVIDNKQICYSSKSCHMESGTLYDSILADEKSGILSELNSSFMFSTGTELHEALGPEFMKHCYPFPSETEKPEDGSTSQIPEAIDSSMLTSNSGTDHLLEAVVADFCHRDALKSRKSFSNSNSMLTTERIPESAINTSHSIGSSCYSIGCSSLMEESIQNCLNSSGSCGIRSSASVSRDQLMKSGDAGKSNKKRARPGENSRPRPRDRQLIQDRIKELRDLVPNGSKCSIDSLLERTIKHMVYMQNVTTHSDKLIKCAKSKGCSEMGAPGSGNEQGSSWAVEVGGHMKICPILVENLDTNGKMLIEMLCEDCDYFLEITEAIKSLGLTILKGITDGHGDKTWMRFVVEGQNNRNLHRMDVLWSLVQILQSKTTVS